MTDGKQRKMLSGPISYVMFGLIGFLFLFCCLTGRDLAEQGNILWTKAYTGRMLAICLIFGGILGGVICVLFRRLIQNQHERHKSTDYFNEVSEGKRGARGKVFGLCLALILLAWLPAYLAYYPAICTYDSPNQTGQIVSGFYIDHHPIAHTLLIKYAMTLGDGIFNSVNMGIGFYGLLQMLFLALAFSFGIMLLWKRRIKYVCLILVELYCMLYPFHHYMSISMTKDTVFSGFFLLFICVSYEMLESGVNCLTSGRDKVFPMHKNTRKMELLYVVAIIGMMLFRNNGKYALLVLLIFGLISFISGKKRRGFWGRLFLLSVAGFCVGGILLSAIYRAVDGNQGDRREMLSIPIQQLARTMVYHGGAGVRVEDDNSMDEKDKALIDDFLLGDCYKNYVPSLADPVKGSTNTYVARYRTKEFLSTYLGLFISYPGDYLNAALAVDAGYLYPGDISHAYVNKQMSDLKGEGYIQTYWDEATLNERGIFKDSKWPWLFEHMEKWADDNAYLRLPVLKYLFVPGVWIWLYLLLAGWLLLQRKFSLCLPLTLVFGYFLTLLLGPTVQLRYIYPMMIAFPFALLAATCPCMESPSVQEKACTEEAGTT